MLLLLYIKCLNKLLESTISRILTTAEIVRRFLRVLGVYCNLYVFHEMKDFCNFLQHFHEFFLTIYKMSKVYFELELWYHRKRMYHKFPFSVAVNNKCLEMTITFLNVTLRDILEMLKAPLMLCISEKDVIKTNLIICWFKT